METIKEEIVLGLDFAFGLGHALFLSATRSKQYQGMTTNTVFELDDCIKAIKKEVNGKRVTIEYSDNQPFDVLRNGWRSAINCGFIREIARQTLAYSPHETTIKRYVGQLVAQQSKNDKVKRRARNILNSNLNVADNQTLEDKVNDVLTKYRCYTDLGNGFYNVRAEGSIVFKRLIMTMESSPSGINRKAVWVNRPPENVDYIAHVIEDTEIVTVSVLANHTIKRNRADE